MRYEGHAGSHQALRIRNSKVKMVASQDNVLNSGLKANFDVISWVFNLIPDLQIRIDDAGRNENIREEDNRKRGV